MGKGLHDQEFHDAAVAELETWLKSYAGCPAQDLARLCLARSLAALKRSSAAEAPLQALLRDTPDSPHAAEARFLLAGLLHERGECREALRLLEGLEGALPKQKAAIWLYRGLCHEQGGQAKPALNAFSSGIAAASKGSTTWRNLTEARALLHYREKRWNECWVDLKALGAPRKGLAGTYLHVAAEVADLAWLDKQARKLHPELPAEQRGTLAHLIGHRYYQKEQWKAAAEWLELAENPALDSALARCYAQLSRWEEVLRVLPAPPEPPADAYYRAVALLRLERSAEALAALGELLARPGLAAEWACPARRELLALLAASGSHAQVAALCPQLADCPGKAPLAQRMACAVARHETGVNLSSREWQELLDSIPTKESRSRQQLAELRLASQYRQGDCAGLLAGIPTAARSAHPRLPWLVECLLSCADGDSAEAALPLLLSPALPAEQRRWALTRLMSQSPEQADRAYLAWLHELALADPAFPQRATIEQRLSGLRQQAGASATELSLGELTQQIQRQGWEGLSTEVLYRAALTEYQAGRDAELLAAATAWQESPLRPRSWALVVGMSASRLERPQQAAQFWELAGADPVTLESARQARFHLGVAAFQAQQWEQALRLLDGVELAGAGDALFYYRGAAQLSAGQHSGGEATLRGLIAGYPADNAYRAKATADLTEYLEREQRFAESAALWREFAASTSNPEQARYATERAEYAAYHGSTSHATE